MSGFVPSCDPNPPRYLFRAASVKSAGVSTKDKIVPGGGDSMPGMPEGFEKMPEGEARELLNLYFAWGRCEAHFTSWSCSLLFVLMHAMRKREHFLEEDTTIWIYILDTRLIKPRVHKATDLISGYKLERESDWMAFCRGEYLVYGALENKPATFFEAAILGELIEHGLLVHFPELGNRSPAEWKRPFKLTANVRAQYSDFTQSLTQMNIDGIKRLGWCFTGNYSFAFMTALVSLHRRDSLEVSGDARLDALLEAAGMRADNTVVEHWPESSIDTKMCEAIQFETLLDMAADIKFSRSWDANERKRRLGNSQEASWKAGAPLLV